MKKWFLWCLLKRKILWSHPTLPDSSKEGFKSSASISESWLHTGLTKELQWSLGSYLRHSAVAGLHGGLDFKFSRGCCFAVRAETHSSVSEPHIIPYFESYWAPWIEELCSLMVCLMAGTGRCELAVGSESASLLEDQNIWDLLSLFSCSVVSNSLWPHGLQHARLSCPSPSPRVRSNSWHPIVSFFHPLLLLPSIFFQHQCLFQWINSSYQVAKCWSFSFNISPSNEYSGLTSFRIDWFDIFAVQRTLKSLLQHHSLKASILRHLTFFTVQLLHLYRTTGKIIALIIWTFVSKVMSLLFNTLSRFVIAFLPRSKGLLVSWLQPPSSVILESKKIKSLTVSIVSPSICYKVMVLEAMILVFWMLSFKSAFSLSSFISSRGSLVPLCFLP